MRRGLFTYLLLMLLPLMALSQDPQFSQYFYSRTQLNPAFTGNTKQSRVIANYRNQWSAIPGGFNTYTVSYDHNLYSSGLGLHIMQDRAGSGGLVHTRISGAYSYQLQISRKVATRFGVQGTYVSPSVDFSDLTFADQIARGNGGVASVETFRLNAQKYIDFGSGILVFTERIWAGFAAHHLNRPSNSFLNQESNLPIKYSVHAGANIPTVRTSKADVQQSVTFNMQYKAQAKFDQFELGAYYQYLSLVGGIAYRGLPLKQYAPGVNNADAVVMFLGFQDPAYGIQFGYSYDLTISRLVNSSGGAHEVSVTYEFASPKPRKRRTRSRLLIPCAYF